MRLYLLLMLLFTLTVFNSQSQQATTPVTLFAQCLFDISNQTEMNTLQDEMNANPYVEMVRLDFHTQRALIMTHDITALSEEEFKTWFGGHSSTVYCVQIGVRGVDKMNPYPFDCD